MLNRLHRHFSLIAIGLYLVTLIVVSLCFRDYALHPLWIGWGCLAVGGFFIATWLCNQQWKHDTPKAFTKKIFWIALGIRAVYVGAMMFYYYYETGISMEYCAADSLRYHFTAGRMADLARQGQFSTIFATLNGSTMGFSDQGYILYLTFLYTLFGKNILGPRLLKALMSAYMCVAIYKLASRSLDERTGRLAAVMALFLPQFIHYTGTYMKETELVFLATLALERMDYLLRSKRYTFWNIFFPILLTALTFGFRTIVGMMLLGSFLIFILFGNRDRLTSKTKWAITGALVVVAAVFFFTPIGKEMAIVFKVNFHQSNFQTYKYEYLGLKYAQYASYKYTAPGAFVLPLTNLVEVANENQKLMNGGFFIKNYLAFFAMWCIVVALREKRWRDFTLTGSYTIVYVLTIALSFAFNSERYHFPELPGMLLMAAFAMTHFRKKDFPFYYLYLGLLAVAIVAWNYIKLDGRGLIF